MTCSNLRFLVVEDHEFQRNLLVRLLRSLGAGAVHEARDGEAALRILADPQRPLDIVVTDLFMPGMDGSGLVRHLGATGSRAVLILLSAAPAELLAAAGDEARAGRVRVLGTVAKPLTARKLQPLIDRFHAEDPAGSPRA